MGAARDGGETNLDFLEGLKMNFKKVSFSYTILNSRKQGQIHYFWGVLHHGPIIVFPMLKD